MNIEEFRNNAADSGELLWCGEECKGADRFSRVPDTPEIAVYRTICYSLLIPLVIATVAFIALAGWKAVVTLPCWAAVFVLYLKTRRKVTMFYAVTDKSVIIGSSDGKMRVFQREQLEDVKIYSEKNGIGCVTFVIDDVKYGFYAIDDAEKAFGILSIKNKNAEGA